MDKTEELMLALKEGNWEHGESLWLEFLESGIDDIESFRKAAKILWNRGQRKLALDLLDMTASTAREANNTRIWLEALRIQAEYNPISKGLVANFAEAFKRFYGERKHLSCWVDKVLGKNLPTTQFIQTLDKLAIFEEGMFVEHKSGWGIGKIQKILEDEIIVDLEQRPNHRMDALAASECLTPLDSDNFDVLLKYQPELLKKEALENPVKVVCRVLKHAGEPLSTQRIKQYLCPGIIEKDDWNRWWTKSRKLLMAEPYVEAASGAHARYSLREKPVSWEDEVCALFDRAEIIEKPAIVLDYLKNTNEKRHLGDFAQAMAALCRQHCEQNQPWYALECYLVLKSCQEQGNVVVNTVDLSHILGDDPMSVYAHVRMASLAQASWKIAREHDPDWEQKISMVFKKGTDLARDTTFRYLMRDPRFHERILLIFQEIISSRLSYPDAYIWTTRHILQEHLPDKYKLFDLVETCVEMIETGGTFRAIKEVESAKRLSKLFTPAVITKVCNLLDDERAHRIFNILIKNTWLPSSLWETLKHEIQDRFPKLFSKVKPIYTTRLGLEKYERELQDLLQNKVPENTRAIGHALEFGDVSENAELDAARELQWQLMQKAQEMRNNLARAQVIDLDAVGTDKVHVGNSVTLKNAEGQEVKYTILGPWDVNPSKGVVSFMSPLAQKLLGVGPNDTVSLPTGEHKVVAIERCLEDISD